MTHSGQWWTPDQRLELDIVHVWHILGWQEQLMAVMLELLAVKVRGMAGQVLGWEEMELMMRGECQAEPPCQGPPVYHGM